MDLGIPRHCTTDATRFTDNHLLTAGELVATLSFMASFSSFFFSASACLSFSSRDLLNILTNTANICVTVKLNIANTRELANSSQEGMKDNNVKQHLKWDRQRKNTFNFTLVYKSHGKIATETSFAFKYFSCTSLRLHLVSRNRKEWNGMEWIIWHYSSYFLLDCTLESCYFAFH